MLSLLISKGSIIETLGYGNLGLSLATTSGTRPHDVTIRPMEIDLLIIGGGINGCGVAADAAGRGLSVVLCEKDDLAFATSSASTKLIHGGLRYLEQYNFKLVREALKEREILMKKAPFLIHPIEIVLPHNHLLRPVFMIRIGLWLYDHLHSGRSLPASKKLKLSEATEGQPLKSKYKIGFSYSDCQTDDARLVVLNAIAARENGAKILTRTNFKSAHRKEGHWIAELHDETQNEDFTIKAKAIVNASGPWVTDVINDVGDVTTENSIRLVKGSHIVVPKLYEGTQAYILQNPDRRVVFTIPYKNKFTLIGTTEVAFEGNPNQAAISNVEINYLCDTINRYFTKELTGEEVVWSYAGVRPLYDNKASTASELSREYHLEVEDDHGSAPMLSVFGGKITTYRTLAEAVLKKLKPYFPNMGKSWTANETLPGGDCDGLSYAEFIVSLGEQYPWLPAHLVHRYAASYGDLCHAILADTDSIDALGKHFGAGLYEKELKYLVQNEWAQTVDDCIWRRSKLGLFLTSEEIETIKSYLP